MLSADQLLVFLLQLASILALAMAFGRLAARLGMPAVVGELLVGILLGPSLLLRLPTDLSGRFFPGGAEQMHLLDAVAQIGVLLLVGVTGMHLDLDLVRRRGRTAVMVSGGGLIVPLGLGIGAAFLLPAGLSPKGADRVVFALFLGVAMCVSAIPVIAKTLMDMRLLHRNVGQLTLTAGVIDDVFGWFMLSVVSSVAVAGVRGTVILQSLASVAVVALISLTAGRWAVRHTFRLVGLGNEPGPVVAAAVVLILLAAAATHALRLEPILGAFLAGILIGRVGGIEPARLAPLRTIALSVLGPVFFATAGLRMDLGALLDPRIAVAGLGMLAVAIIGKFVGAWAGAKLSGLNRWEALALGAGLNARGVIEVTVAMVGLRLGILSVPAYTIVVLIAVVTSLMAPPLLRLAMERVERTADEELREARHREWSRLPDAVQSD
ncbi:cation:proton antiporter [Actinomadura sp. KC06]|uniref:cation:proton antiporter n=1 Tax=Actinomadura sp. KC06 TaxID=2530369 RepID=UPI001A9F83E9|nr:cation:proton antiporter [Actinomadura sp. KC06]